jgi:spore coat protein SA
MKILVVAPPAFSVSAFTGGSVEICIFQIAKRVANTHQVTIICRKAGNLPQNTVMGNLSIVRIPAGKRYLSQVIAHARKHSYDAIQVENRPSYVPVLRRSFPEKSILLVLHSLLFMGYLSTEKQKKVLRDASHVICNSHFVRNYYAHKFPMFRNKIHTIHLGVDLSRFRQPTPEERKRILTRYSLKGSYNILYTGRIIRMKGIRILVKAVGILRKKYPQIRLVLAGPCNPSFLHEIKELAEKSNVPLKYLGKISPAHIHRVYWLGDCFVLPTQFQEAFGLVNVEAMASGLPVIAAKRGGITEIINNRNGILVDDYTNPIAYARAIASLLDSPEKRSSMINEAKQTVIRKFSWDTAATGYLRFYARILKTNL